MSYVLLGLSVVVVALLVAVVYARRRRQTDAVADFQRQIGALSSEARRSVVDQVNRLDARAEAPRHTSGDETGSPDGPPHGA